MNCTNQTFIGSFNVQKIPITLKQSPSSFQLLVTINMVENWHVVYERGNTSSLMHMSVFSNITQQVESFQPQKALKD